MYKGSDIIGKPIFAYDTGKQLEEQVLDLILDQDNNQLLGFLVKEKTLLNYPRVLPLARIQAIGVDGTIVAAESSVVTADEVPEIQQILERNNVIKGTIIMTEDGRDLGKMVDLYFDAETGKVEGYEVSGGLFADTYSGRSFVPAPTMLKIGEDVAFVPSATADMMEEQVGGIKAAMQSASETIKETAEATSSQLQSATQKAGEKLEIAKRNAAASATNAIVDPAEQKAFVVGKTADRDVTASDGTLLVSEGQTITLEEARAAQNKGALDILYRAAGGRPEQKASEQLLSAAQTTGDKLKAATEKVGDKVDELKRDATTSATNAVVDPAKQKEFAIGKTVDRSLAAPDGTLLVAQGQQVTASIAGTAERWGMLDELYRAAGGSVWDELSQKATSPIAAGAVEEARGRRVRQMVRGEDGLIIAAPGQIVSKRTIDIARKHNREKALLEAVGLSTGKALKSRGASTASSAGEQLQTNAQKAGEQLQEGAQELWQNLKDAAKTSAERSAQMWEERRIKGALGRPVNRVILDRNDSVLLNVGDLITNQAIERARQAGVLEILLDSVYSEPPPLSKEDLRAPEEGEASLSTK